MDKAKQPRLRSPSLPESQTVIIRLNREEVALADKYAQQDSRSRSSFIRLMLLDGIAEFERRQTPSRRRSA